MDSTAFSFRVFVPEDSQAPVEFYDDVNAFRVAAVHKSHVGKLTPEWDVPAVYALLGERSSGGGWDAYVGKAPAGVKARLRQHVRGKEGWSRALIVVRDTTMGMNSAQIGWLEGRLHEMLMAEYPDVRMLNNVQPGDKTLMAHDYVESAVVTVRNTLRVLGYVASATTGSATKGASATSGVQKASTKSAVKKSVYYGVTLKDLLNQNILQTGTRIVSTRGSAQGIITITGEVNVDGKVFPSLSAAGQYIRGGATNGWEFWAVKQQDGTLKTMAEYREQYQKDK
jgi:hypothetical protein